MTEAELHNVAQPVGLAVRAETDLLARALDVIPDGVFVHRGADHVVVALNRTGRALLGDRDVVGRPAAEHYPPELVPLLDGVYASGEPAEAREWRFVVARRDGRHEERHVDFVVVPLRDDGRITGVITRFVDVTAATLRRRALETDTVELQQRYAAAQDVVLRMQKSLLPPGLPVLPGVRMAARYLVTQTELAAGGDWFDAVALDGRVAAVVGDVVGHGAEAAAVMGQLRAVLTELLHDAGAEFDPAAVLARLDRAATRLPGARGATVCLTVLDPLDGAVEYACAGHPPPLVVGLTGEPRFLPLTGGGPLGTPGPVNEVGRTTLQPGEVLVCFSDGLVERVGRDLAVGAKELATAAADAVRMDHPDRPRLDLADRVAETLLERMEAGGYEDDVTLLVLRRTGELPVDLHMDVPATADQLGAVRRRLLRWLDSMGATPADRSAIEIAVLEAVSNAVQHAYSEPGGRVRVEGRLAGSGRVHLSVSDEGRWRAAPPEPGGRGRGLAMIRSCMDEVEIERTPGGTTVLLDLALRTEPVLGAAPPVLTAPQAGSELRIAVTRGADPRLVVRGPIDISTVRELRRELRETSRGGALPLTVDLAGVTHLASAGIELLYGFVEEMKVDGSRVVLVAPPGSPAAYALRLSGLDRLVAT